MPIQESALSVAIRSLADFLSLHITEDVLVTVTTPPQAYEQARTSGANILNVFAYNIAPADIRASADHEQSFFVRAYVLITAFARGQGEPEQDVELRLLGRVIEVLHRSPVIPVTFPESGFGAEVGHQSPSSRLQCVLHPCSMEEMNHIWSTQAGELPYRLSLAYELAPIFIATLNQNIPALTRDP